MLTLPRARGRTRGAWPGKREEVWRREPSPPSTTTRLQVVGETQGRGSEGGISCTDTLRLSIMDTRSDSLQWCMLNKDLWIVQCQVCKLQCAVRSVSHSRHKIVLGIGTRRYDPLHRPSLNYCGQ